MQPLLALVDCNNFYVSCERVFRPDLIGKPVAVLSNNDGCIVARSGSQRFGYQNGCTGIPDSALGQATQHPAFFL